MLDGIKNTTLGKLISSLHKSILSTIKSTKTLSEMNDKITNEEIVKLRENVKAKLDRGEDIEDNKSLIELLNLFSTNKKVIEYLKYESEDWIDLLKAIERNLVTREDSLTVEEKKEIAKIMDLIKDVKEIIREEEGKDKN
ncbi:MAG: hypothetical protein ACP5RI_01640 [Candidatus Micrarchaeia archaeon]